MLTAPPLILKKKIVATALDVVNENKNEYIIGTETGFVFKCNTAAASPLDQIKKIDKGL